MNLLNLAITQTCNKRCYYCPVIDLLANEKERFYFNEILSIDLKFDIRLIEGEVYNEKGTLAWTLNLRPEFPCVQEVPIKNLLDYKWHTFNGHIDNIKIPGETNEQILLNMQGDTNRGMGFSTGSFFIKNLEIKINEKLYFLDTLKYADKYSGSPTMVEKNKEDENCYKISPVNEKYAWYIMGVILAPKFNAVNNEAIIKYLDAYLNPRLWFIEITGGEPSCYPDLDSLLLQLTKRGYKGVVKTNGFKKIIKTDNFIRVFSMHDFNEIPPRDWFDKIVLINNPNDADLEKKKNYCVDNNIPYKLTVFGLVESNLDPFQPADTKFENLLAVNSLGQITSCPGSTENLLVEKNIFKMQKVLPKKLSDGCLKCKVVNDFEIFMPSEWKVAL